MVTTMATQIFEGFSLSHAAILDGSTAAELADIYGIREGSIEVDTDSYDNTGDDAVLSSWSWINFANLSITSGFIPLELVSLLQGTTVTTDETVPEEPVYSTALWNENSTNQPFRPVLVRVPSKDSEGTPRRFDIILYKCQFGPISFDGPTYRDGMAVSYTAKALMSDKDELGAALPERAIGRLISAAPIAPAAPVGP